MEVCRAFDIFEIIIAVIFCTIEIVLLLIVLFNLRSFTSFIKSSTTKGVVSTMVAIILGVAILLALWGTYMYIKSMFC